LKVDARAHMMFCAYMHSDLPPIFRQRAREDKKRKMHNSKSRKEDKENAFPEKGIALEKQAQA
jgi:hypothetical protein